MAIYSNGIKYGMAGYGKEFVGGDLVWQNGLAVGTTIVPTHTAKNQDIIFTFKGLKSDLSNVPHGIKINFRRSVPIFASFNFQLDEEETYEKYDTGELPESEYGVDQEYILFSDMIDENTTLQSTVEIKKTFFADNNSISLTIARSTYSDRYTVYTGLNEKANNYQSYYNGTSPSPLIIEKQESDDLSLKSKKKEFESPKEKYFILLIDSIEVY